MELELKEDMMTEYEVNGWQYFQKQSRNYMVRPLFKGYEVIGKDEYNQNEWNSQKLVKILWKGVVM